MSAAIVRRRRWRQRLTWRLVVERQHVTAAVPHDARVVVGGVDAPAVRVDAAQLVSATINRVASSRHP